MRVAIAITSLGVGGAERQVIDLGNALASRGVEVLVVSAIAPDDWASAAFLPEVDVEHLGMHRGTPDPRAIFRLRKMLNRWEPDVVHSHMIHANIMTRLARPGASWALVGTIHNRPTSKWWLERLQSFSQSLSGLTTIVSKDALDEYLARGLVSEPRTRIVYNGVEIDRFAADGPRANRESQFVWSSIGSLTSQKDYHTLLRAVSTIAADAADYRVQIAGTGELDSTLRQAALSLGVADRVTFLGHVDDIPGLLRGSDGIVNSSTWEGLPISLIEASAAAKPIVATDVGGTREIVRHGSSGVLTSPGDAQSLADAMMMLMMMPAGERSKMGARGRDWTSDHFDLASITNQWLAIYKSLLTGRSTEVSES